MAVIFPRYRDLDTWPPKHPGDVYDYFDGRDLAGKPVPQRQNYAPNGNLAGTLMSDGVHRWAGGRRLTQANQPRIRADAFGMGAGTESIATLTGLTGVQFTRTVNNFGTLRAPGVNFDALPGFYLGKFITVTGTTSNNFDWTIGGINGDTLTIFRSASNAVTDETPASTTISDRAGTAYLATEKLEAPVWRIWSRMRVVAPSSSGSGTLTLQVGGQGGSSLPSSPYFHVQTGLGTGATAPSIGAELFVAPPTGGVQLSDVSNAPGLSSVLAVGQSVAPGDVYPVGFSFDGTTYATYCGNTVVESRIQSAITGGYGSRSGNGPYGPYGFRRDSGDCLPATNPESPTFEAMSYNAGTRVLTRDGATKTFATSGFNASGQNYGRIVTQDPAHPWNGCHVSWQGSAATSTQITFDADRADVRRLTGASAVQARLERSVTSSGSSQGVYRAGGNDLAVLPNVGVITSTNTRLDATSLAISPGFSSIILGVAQIVGGVNDGKYIEVIASGLNVVCYDRNSLDGPTMQAVTAGSESFSLQCVSFDLFRCMDAMVRVRDFAVFQCPLLPQTGLSTRAGSMVSAHLDFAPQRSDRKSVRYFL